MKVKVVQTVEKEAKFLYAYLGDYMYLEDLNFMDLDVCGKLDKLEDENDLDGFLKIFPSLNASRYNQDMRGICLKIDIDTGKVINWPTGMHEVQFIDIKIVDSGTYVLTDEEGNILIKKEGYVPNCLQIEDNGFGDYLEFVVDKNGVIIDWSFKESDVKEFEEYEQ